MSKLKTGKRKFGFIVLMIVLFFALYFSLQGFAKSKIRTYETSVDGYVYKLRPMSSESLLSINYKDIDLRDSEEDSILSEYEALSYYTFEILRDTYNQNSLSKDSLVGNVRNKRAEYYLFQMQSDLSLINVVGDTLPCAVFYQEQNPMSADVKRYVVGFSISKWKQIEFLFKDPNQKREGVSIKLN